MRKTIELYYCDRCGKEMVETEYFESHQYINTISPVHHVCKKCWDEYKQKENELLNWINMNGKAVSYLDSLNKENDDTLLNQLDETLRIKGN